MQNVWIKVIKLKCDKFLAPWNGTEDQELLETNTTQRKIYKYSWTGLEAQWADTMQGEKIQK